MSQQNLLRRQEVEAICQLGRSSIYRLMRKGKFPLPIRVGERSVRWSLTELQDWLAERPRATGNGE